MRRWPEGAAPCLLAWGVLLGISAPSAAALQRDAPTSAPVPSAASAAATITAAELGRHIGALAADSMRGRVTPSPELERAAAYVADQFRELGLKPPGQDDWIQRYLMPGQLKFDRAQSGVSLMLDLPALTESGDSVYTSAYLAFDSPSMYFLREVGAPTVGERTGSLMLDDIAGSSHAVVLAGPYSSVSLPAAAIRDRVVFYIPAASADSTAQRQILARLYELSAGVILISDLDSASFAAAAARDRSIPVRFVDRAMRRTMKRWPWAVAIRAAAVERLLRRGGVDVMKLRDDATPVAQALPLASVWLLPKVDTTSPKRTAPNVVAILDGVDTALKDSYILLSAHLDAADTVDPRTDDDASGVAGLLALAKAFSQPGARPRHSLIFVATSGGAAGKGAWGSNAYVDNAYHTEHLAAVLNLDRIGGRAGDSLFIDGLTDVALAHRLDWLAAEHPELKLSIMDGGTAVRPGAEYFPFVRSGIPTLAFHAGRDSARSGGDVTADVPAERAARLVQLIFHVVRSIADDERPPRWTTEGRQRFAASWGP